MVPGDSVGPRQLKITDGRAAGRVLRINPAVDGIEGFELAGGQVIFDGTGPGLSVTQPTADQESALTAITFDLDDHERGVIYFELRLTFGTKGDAGINFQTPTDNFIRGQISIPSLKTLAAYAAQGTNFRRIGAIEIDRGSTRIGLLIAGAAINAQNELEVFIRNLGMAPDATSQNTFSIGTNLYAVLLGEGAPTSTSNRAHYLTEQDQVPGTNGYSVGDITNVQGHLYELVDDASEANVITGVSAARTGGYVGTAAFEWLPTGSGKPRARHAAEDCRGQFAARRCRLPLPGTGSVCALALLPESGSGERHGRAAAGGGPGHHRRLRLPVAHHRRAHPRPGRLRVPRLLLAAAGHRRAAVRAPVVVHTSDRWELYSRTPAADMSGGLDQAAVDARIVAGVQNWARDAVTAIPAGKLSNQRFTAALLAKLNGIAAGAEVNVNADWNATSGDAQILNKPALPAPGSGSGTPPAFAAGGSLATAINLPVATTNQWSHASNTSSTWQLIATTAAMTRNGIAVINFEGHAESNGSSGGGDRIFIQIALLRTRSSVTTELARTTLYMRNANNLGTVVSPISQTIDGALAHIDEAHMGDTFTIRARAIRQGATRSGAQVTFPVGTTTYQVALL